MKLPIIIEFNSGESEIISKSIRTLNKVEKGSAE